jgi:hypothetical protein
MTSLQPYFDWEANGPSYFADIEVEEETKSTTDEVWHVAIAWDDIKTMSLDQLDDAFRLDVIAADTPVWKEGMSGWQPLSVVAGMEEEEEVEEATVMRPAPFIAPRASKAPSPPPRPPTRASVPPARAAAAAPPRAPAPRASAPAPAPRSASVPAPQSVPMRPPARQSAPPLHAVPQAPVQTQPRMAAVPQAPVRTQPRMAAVQSIPSARPASPASLAPPGELAFARSMAPPSFRRAPVRRASGMAWFFVPLVLAGGLFAAYRNDLLLDAAKAVHQEDHYLAAERLLLGVPGFGTPRSVASRGLTTESTSTTESTDATHGSLRDAPRAMDTARVAEPIAKSKPSEPIAPAPAPKAIEPSKPSTPPPAPIAEARKPAPAPVERAMAKAAPPPAPARSFAPSPAPVAKAAPPPPPVQHSEPPASTRHGDVKAAKVVLAESDDDSSPTPSKRHGKKGHAAVASDPVAAAAAASFGTMGRHEEPEPAPAPKPAPKPEPKAKAAPPPPAPEAPPPTSGNSALDDAIRAAVKKKTSAAAAKKKGPNAEYDPLNSDL